MATVHCKNCNKGVEPVKKGKRFRCPDCNLFVANPHKAGGGSAAKSAKRAQRIRVKQKKTEQPPAEQQKPQMEYGAKITGEVDPRELQLLQDMVNSGLVKNQSEAIKKGINALAIMHHMGDDETMATQREPGNGVGIDMLDEAERALKLEQLKNLVQKEEDPFKELLKMKADMAKMQQYDRMLGGSGDNGGELFDKNLIKQVMMMKMMNNMFSDDNKQNNGQMVALQQQIQGMENAFKQRMQELGYKSEIDKLREDVKGSQQKGLSTEDVLKFQAERQASSDKHRMEINQKEMQLQKERDENLKLQMEHWQEGIKGFVESSKKKKTWVESFGELQEAATMMKQMGKLMGQGNIEPSKMEALMAAGGQLANAVAPALDRIMQIKQMQAQQQMGGNPGTQGNPQTLTAEEIAKQYPPGSPQFEQLPPQDKQVVQEYHDTMAAQQSQSTSQSPQDLVDVVQGDGGADIQANADLIDPEYDGSDFENPMTSMALRD